MVKMLYLIGLLGAAARLRSAMMGKTDINEVMRRGKKVVYDQVASQLSSEKLSEFVQLSKKMNPNYNGLGQEHHNPEYVLECLEPQYRVQAAEFPLAALVMTQLGPADFADAGAFGSRREFVNPHLANPGLWHNGKFLRVMKLGKLFRGPKDAVAWVASFMHSNPDLNDLQGFNDAQAKTFPLEALVMKLLGPADFAADGAFDPQRDLVNAHLADAGLWHEGKFLRVMNLGKLFHGLRLPALIGHLSALPPTQTIQMVIEKLREAEELADPDDHLNIANMLMKTKYGAMKYSDWMPKNLVVTKTEDGFHMVMAEDMEDEDDLIMAPGFGEEEDQEEEPPVFNVTFPGTRIVVEVPRGRLEVDVQHRNNLVDVRRVTIHTTQGIELELRGEDGNVILQDDLYYFHETLHFKAPDYTFVKLLLKLRETHRLFQ